MVPMPVFLSFDIGFRHWYDVVGAGAEVEFFLRGVPVAREEDTISGGMRLWD